MKSKHSTKTPVFSIVVPCFNGAAYLEKTLKSLVNQRPRPQIIFVDGCSTDNSLEIANSILVDSDIIISEPDHGMYDAINKGFKLASGAYLAYLNTDDIYYSNTLRQVEEYFSSNPSVDLLYGDLAIINEYDKVKYIHKYPFFNKYLFERSSYSNIGQPASFWRRQVFDANIYFDSSLKMVGDFKFFIDVANAGFEIKHVSLPLAKFRVHSFSLTSSQKYLNTNELLIIKKSIPFSIIGVFFVAIYRIYCQLLNVNRILKL